MKKTAWITLLLCLTAFSSALASDKLSFGVSGGLSKPTGDFNDFLASGYHVGMSGEYELSKQLGIGIGVDYLYMGASDDYISLVEGELAGLTKAALLQTTGELHSVEATLEQNYTVIPITLYSKWTPAKGAAVSPYVQLGGGGYLMTTRASVTLEVPDLGVNTTGSSSENLWRPGIVGGLGLDYRLGRQVGAGVFARLHNIFDSGESVRFYNLGVSLTFGLANK